MILTSFTEPHRLINFNASTHTYTDLHTGKKLISATTHIKQFKKEFDSKEIAKKCATVYGWGVEKDAIISMWENLGSITSAMGDAIHEALERYTNFKRLGETILRNKGRGENPTLPKHPLIRKIITEFEEIDEHYDDYEVLTEVFVSCGEFCGLIDRLYINHKRKTFRLGDLKINIKANDKGQQTYIGKFSHLPTTKVSGYRLQLSFYAKIMKKAGWKLDGMDAFVLDEKWSKIEIEELDGVVDLDGTPITSDSEVDPKSKSASRVGWDKIPC